MIKNYATLFSALLLIISIEARTVTEQAGGKSFPANRQTHVELKSKQGNIYIRTWSKNSVEVGFEFETEDSFKNWEIYSEGNTIHIKQKHQRYSGSGDIQLSIPQYVSLKASTCGGNVSIQGNLSSSLECYSCSGDIDIDDIKGSVNLKTSGGNVLAKNITGNFSLNTSGGDVFVAVVKGDGEMRTSGGNISAKKLDGKVIVATAGGDITLDEQYGDAKVSTAGGDIFVGRLGGYSSLKTAGGDITVNSLDGESTMLTSAGDISVTKINGSIDAKTSAGDISAEYITAKGESRLFTTYGNVNISIGPKAKMSLSAQVNVTGWWNESDDYTEYLSSEFPGSSLKRDDKRKKIYGEYKINGGGPAVSVVVSTGSIIIKKIK